MQLLPHSLTLTRTPTLTPTPHFPPPQFTVPLSSRIKVSPNVGRLSVNSTIRVEVSYSPKEEDFGELGEAGIMKPGGEMRGEGGGEGGDGVGIEMTKGLDCVVLLC